MGGVRQDAAVILSWLENVLGDRAASFEEIRQPRKVLPANYVELNRAIFGDSVSPGLERLVKQRSGAALAR